ncbi:MAG: hypothetical protein Q9209_003142 [Squamulea sp. 1 TL-2023]
MPEIMYMYKPPKERAAFKALRPSAPSPKYDAQGNIVYEKWPSDPAKPQPLLDFPHLPDQISTREWWWVFEAWRRYDPRITWKDIFMRQYRPNRKKSENTMQGLVSRARSSAMMVSWPGQPPQLTSANKKKADEKKADQQAAKPNTDDHQDPISKQSSYTKAKGKTVRNHLGKSPNKSIDKPDNKERDRVTELMTAAQIAANSTRGHTPGLINPSLGETPGNRVPWPKRKRTAGQHQTTRPTGDVSGGNNESPRVELGGSAAHKSSMCNSDSPSQTNDVSCRSLYRTKAPSADVFSKESDELIGSEDVEGDTEDAEGDVPWVEDDQTSDIPGYEYDEAIQGSILGRSQSTQSHHDMGNKTAPTAPLPLFTQNTIGGPPLGTFETSDLSPSSSTPAAPTRPGASTSRQDVPIPTLPVPQYNPDNDLYGVLDNEYEVPGGRTSGSVTAPFNNPAAVTTSSPFRADPLNASHANAFLPAVIYESSIANNGMNLAGYASRSGLSPARWLELLITLHAQGYGQSDASH